MSSKPTSPHTLDLTTRLYVRELYSGAWSARPLADAELVSFGTGEVDLGEQQMFLAEYLRRMTPDVLSRYALPPDTALQIIRVQIDREDLPRSLQPRVEIAFPCAVVPVRRELWVMVLPLAHTFHVGRDAKTLQEATIAEIRRLCVARELSPWEYLRLLPADDDRLQSLTISIDQSDKAVAGKASALRKALAEKRASRRAAKMLASVGTPLHQREDVLSGPPIIGRDAQVAQLGALLRETGKRATKRRNSVLLVGPELSGKSAVLHAWLRTEGDQRPLIFATSGSQLIAGMSGLGQWQARVHRVMEAAERLDAIIYFEDLADLLADRPSGGVDIPGAIRPFVEDGRVRVIGELRSEALDHFERRHAGLISSFFPLRIDALDKAGAQQVLVARIEHQKQREPHRPTLSPAAVTPLLDLVDRYLPYRAYPGKAVRLLEDVRIARDADRDPEGGHVLLSAQRVYETFSAQTGIPLFLLRDDEPLKTAEVRDFFTERLVGQQQAIDRVVETVCAIKANLQPEGKPLASFLFIGPTGVGKTEVARLLARFLFGAAERMVRFDMTEYQDPGAAQRLIHGTEGSEGLLTRRVRQQPFSVVLLDEIEKAHSAVFDLLLQVLGEGRLTDARGKLAFFHNTIVIMTSNLGAAHRDAAIGLTRAALSDEAYYQKQVDRSFRPEFVNRIDRIVTFHPLAADQAERVVKLAVARLAKSRGFEERGVTLAVAPSALSLLAERGHSRHYGARSLRRALDALVVAPACRLLGKVGQQARHSCLSVTAREGGSPTDEHAHLGDGRLPSTSGNIIARAQDGDLLLTLEKTGVPRRRQVTGARDISALRRQVNRWFTLESVESLREQVHLLVSQLSYGGGRQRKRPKRIKEAAALHRELGRLEPIWRALEAQREELRAVEELALFAALDDEPVLPFAAPADQAYRRFRGQLFYALVAQQAARDEITLLLQELDTRCGFDRWLRPLLQTLATRKWRATFHVRDGDRQAEDQWPPLDERRWGPPRTAAQLVEQFWTDDANPVHERNQALPPLLMRCKGPYAASILATEVGLHRWADSAGSKGSKGSKGQATHMLCAKVRMSTTIGDDDWTAGAFEPAPPVNFSLLRKRKAVRETVIDQQLLKILDDTARLDVSAGAYWQQIEEIALEHLLIYDSDEDRDIDELY